MSPAATVRRLVATTQVATPRLRLAKSNTKAARTPFVTVIIGLTAAGFVGLIFLSTVLQQQAFEIAQLDAQISTLTNEKQSMDRDLDRLKSPAGLGKAAADLGMVPNPNPVFINLSDGSVKGKPKPASRTDVVRVAP